MPSNPLNSEYMLIKPHHLLDYLYDLAVDFDHEHEVNYTGSNNGILCIAFCKGQIRKIKFTPFVDDICKPCKNLLNDKKCSDTFDEATTKAYGTISKHEFNYQLDMKLNAALPKLFQFDEVKNTIDVLYELQKYLTEEIVDLYLWKRPSRYKNTLKGIAKAIELYK